VLTNGPKGPTGPRPEKKGLNKNQSCGPFLTNPRKPA
jgi:hypothetical protein